MCKFKVLNTTMFSVTKLPVSANIIVSATQFSVDTAISSESDTKFSVSWTFSVTYINLLFESKNLSQNSRFKLV